MRPGIGIVDAILLLFVYDEFLASNVGKYLGLSATGTSRTTSTAASTSRAIVGTGIDLVVGATSATIVDNGANVSTTASTEAPITN